MVCPPYGAHESKAPWQPNAVLPVSNIFLFKHGLFYTFYSPKMLKWDLKCHIKVVNWRNKFFSPKPILWHTLSQPHVNLYLVLESKAKEHFRREFYRRN